MDSIIAALKSGQISDLLENYPSLLWERHPRGVTHLHLCAEHDLVDGARVLLEAGHPADAHDKDHYTPLQCACAKGNLETASLLLEDDGGLRSVAGFFG